MAAAAVQLHFAGEVPIEPDASWVTDLRACVSTHTHTHPSADASTPATTGVHELVGLVARALSSTTPIDLEAETERVGAEVGLKPKAARGVIRSLFLLLSGAVKHHVPDADLAEDLTRLGLEPEAAAMIVSAWSPHRAIVSTHARTHAHTHAATHALVDADWRFGVTVATDDVGRVGTTYVQLKMTVERGGRLVTEHMELTIPQFYELLAHFERAKSYMDYLSAAHA